MTSEKKSDPKMNASSFWITKDESELGTYNVEEQEHEILDKFITMGIPALAKFQSGYVAEPGDIEVCLLIQIEKDYEVVVHVCNLDDHDQLKERITVQGPHASAILKAFMTEFPNAVFTTAEFKTLCLFTEIDRSKKIQHFEGPMNYTTFSRIVRENMNKPKHIVVAVQK